MIASAMNETGMGADGTALRLMGAVANPVVHAAYPMGFLTRWHARSHLPGLTGRWMDTGGTALGGAVRGMYHRLSHGHHLFGDGFKVLVNPKLKFGEFLHHLGLDSLTRRGIPNPLVPKMLGEKLLRLGLSPALSNELLTVNVPKILGGGVALVCSGADVYLAFSDAIPHTFMAAAQYLGIGVIEILFGCFPPNPVLLLAGAMEVGVGVATAVRAWLDPVIPALGMPASVFLPMLGQAMAISGLIGCGLGCLASGNLASGIRNGVSAAAASGTAVTAGTAAKAAGWLAAPFIGPLAGIGAFLLTRALLGLVDLDRPVVNYEFTAPLPSPRLMQPRLIPVLGLPPQPVGRMDGNRLVLHGFN